MSVRRVPKVVEPPTTATTIPSGREGFGPVVRVCRAVVEIVALPRPTRARLRGRATRYGCGSKTVALVRASSRYCSERVRSDAPVVHQ